MKKWLAERNVVAERIEDGQRTDITFRVGVPYWVEGEDFAYCPWEVDGLLEKVADAAGTDTLQALQLASNIDGFLAAFKDKYNFYWPTGESYFDHDVSGGEPGDIAPV